MIDDNKNKTNENNEIKETVIASDKDVGEEVHENIVGEKLKNTEEKLLRSLAEIENQRKRFEKGVKDAFEFGSFNFAKESLAILDNLQRAKLAIKNDDSLKSNKDLDKFLENIIIIEKDLIKIFERNRIKKIETIDKNLTLIFIKQCQKLKMMKRHQELFCKKFKLATCWVKDY